jgi:alanine dehydrogenase
LDASATNSLSSRGDSPPCSRTLVLNRQQVASLMSLQDYVAAVEAAFRAYGTGNAMAPVPTHIVAPHGAFHIKSGSFRLDRLHIAVKLNGNFPGNPERSGLPTIQGVIVLCDGEDGTVLAVMDSIEITLRRTAAATVLAARYLAPAQSNVIGLCGCGVQGRAQLQALAAALSLRRVVVWDIDRDKAGRFADEMSRTLSLEVAAVDRAEQATRDAHVVVTATTARTPFLTRDMLRAGAFVAAIGADNPDKSELSPDLIAQAKVVVDAIDQAVTMGDLHHAIEAGVLTAADVHAELADVVLGRTPGRTSEEETIVFDSTGVAIQDVATAVAVWQHAIAANVGLGVDFGALSTSTGQL